MDYLSTQQHKDAMDDTIYRAIAQFERETGAVITEIRISHLDDRCTSVSTRVEKYYGT
jgi:hypothetical protein